MSEYCYGMSRRTRSAIFFAGYFAAIQNLTQDELWLRTLFRDFLKNTRCRLRFLLGFPGVRFVSDARVVLLL